MATGHDSHRAALTWLLVIAVTAAAVELPTVMGSCQGTVTDLRKSFPRTDCAAEARSCCCVANAGNACCCSRPPANPTPQAPQRDDSGHLVKWERGTTAQFYVVANNVSQRAFMLAPRTLLASYLSSPQSLLCVWRS